ncbi:MAG: hypothetical protein WKG07_13055 [Hymenobacter sp.]
METLNELSKVADAAPPAKRPPSRRDAWLEKRYLVLHQAVRSAHRGRTVATTGKHRIDFRRPRLATCDESATTESHRDGGGAG